MLGRLADMAATACRHGVARVDKRLSRLDADWNQIQQDRQQRAARWRQYLEGHGPPDPDDPQLLIPQEVLSGNFVRSVRAVGTGEDLRLIVEYKLDTALLGELRAIERQAAIEAGDWKGGGANKHAAAAMAESPSGCFTVPNQAGPRLDNLLAYIEWLRAEEARGGPAIAPRKQEANP